MGQTSHSYDVFEVAKQRSLTGFLEQQFGYTAKRVSGEARFKTCPDCGESPDHTSVKLRVKNDATFNCFRCGAHGSIIDAAMMLWKVDNLEAAKMLAGDRVGESVVKRTPKTEQETQAEVERRDALHEVYLKLIGPSSSRTDAKIEKYLCIDRSLPFSLVREAQKRKMLGFLPSNPNEAFTMLVDTVGEPLLRKADLWKTDKKMPGIVFRPIIFFFPGLKSAEFRIIGEPTGENLKSRRYGTTDYPWFWKGSDGRGAMLTEGFIDMLSSVALGYTGHILGMPGCNNWKPEWLLKFHENMGINGFDLAFDNDSKDPDNPGQKWSENAGKVLTENNIAYRHLKLPDGDLNVLLKRKAKGK